MARTGPEERLRQLAADTVLSGEDPTFLEEALVVDGTAIDDDCAAAGWTA